MTEETPAPTSDAAPEDRKSELAPGRVIGEKYRLERRVGEGGLGTVWRAAHVQTGKVVALKLLKDDGASQEARQRLLREARVAATLDHPNVRAVLDVLDVDAAPALVMEYLDGCSLAEHLTAHGRLGLPEAAALMIPVISGVGAAHARGLVHRDLKPENIFLVRKDPTSPKILDFGIAKRSGGGAGPATVQTASGAILGTPYYMSPEQVFGEKDLDHRTDIWALGLVLYECLTGELPTRAENVGQVLKIIVTKPIPPIRAVLPELPEDVAALIGRMLSRTADKRPADLREVSAVLERHTDRRAPAFDGPSEALQAQARPADDESPGAPPLAGATTRLDASDAEREAGPARAMDPEEAAPASARPRGPTLAQVALGATALAALAAGLFWFGLRDPVVPTEPAAAPSAATPAPSAPTPSERPKPAPSEGPAATSPPAASASASAAPRASAPPSARAAASATLSAKTSAAPSAFAPSQHFE